jgi:hypothetical protein
MDILRAAQAAVVEAEKRLVSATSASEAERKLCHNTHPGHPMHWLYRQNMDAAWGAKVDARAALAAAREAVLRRRHELGL